MNIQQEINHLLPLWGEKISGMPHEKTDWDARADVFAERLKKDQEEKKNRRRVQATVDYLAAKGILHEKADIIDIGCGPGRFVTEFAKTARMVVGSDLSPRMLEYGVAYAKEQGVYEKTKWMPCDFHTVDVQALGWEKRFDLVFTSITPALNTPESIDQMIRISRGWCFNSCFVDFSDPMEEELLLSLTGKRQPNWRSRYWERFYAMTNLLWLKGYFPEVTYYTETVERSDQLTQEYVEKWATEIAKNLKTEAAPLAMPIYDALHRMADEEGCVTQNSSCMYGWTLWDVNRRVSR